MKPPPFAYHRAGSLDDALTVLQEVGDDAAVLAGGQSLIPLLNLRLARPAVVVDINRLRSLDHVDVHPDAVEVGAMARARAVERHPGVAAKLPVLQEAIRYIAHPQIRVRTTIGGNIAHADPSSELPAVLMAVDGTVDLASRRGRRTVAAADFFRGVFTTARAADELVTGVRFPVHAGYRWRFVELARRHGDYGMAAACVGVRFDDGHFADVRVALAGCGVVPTRARRTEDALRGAAAVPGATAVASETVREEIDPGDDIHASAGYRRALAGVLVSRALASMLENR